jgi:membrane protease YdiL (CAAX protease family)
LTDTDLPSTTIEPEIAPMDTPRPRPTWPTWLEILLCSSYPTQIFVGQVLVLAGVKPQLASGALSPAFVFALSLGDTVLLLSLIVWLLVRRGERPMTVFFGDRPAAQEIAFGMASLPLIIGIVIALTLAVRRFVPALHNVPDNPLQAMVGNGASLWLFLIVVIVAGGVREELQRAFLLHRFRGDLGQPWMGVLITSLAFGMGHTLQGLDAAVITGVLGATWGVMYLTRRSALASLVSHSLFNSGELLRVFLR